MDKFKRLEELRNDIFALELYIEQNSLYNLEVIANTISKLMTAFENTEYVVSYRYDEHDNENCFITEKTIRNFSLSFIIPSIDNMKYKSFIKGNTTDYCFLPPSKYDKKNLNYIQDFIDYLFEYRTSNEKKNLSESEINNCLLEFVEKNKATKNIRIKRRKNQNQTRKNSFLKKEFRSKCMLSRKVMFSNIISLINNYESSNSVAYHSKYSIWESNEQRHTKTEYLYDKLEIKSYGTYTKFESLVDFCEVEEDELENSFIDEKLDTEINFFELKKELISLYDYCPILKKFMDNIEKVLLHKNNLSEDEINDIYLEIVNKYRQKIKRFG